MSDAQPVFDAIARNVTRLLGTAYAVVQIVRDGQIHAAAFHGEPGFERVAASFPRPLHDESLSGQVVGTRRVIQLTPIIGNPQSPNLSEQTARVQLRPIILATMLGEDRVVA